MAISCFQAFVRLSIQTADAISAVFLGGIGARRAIFIARVMLLAQRLMQCFCAGFFWGGDFNAVDAIPCSRRRECGWDLGRLVRRAGWKPALPVFGRWRLSDCRRKAGLRNSG
jgi:hypothetical protein